MASLSSGSDPSGVLQNRSHGNPPSSLQEALKVQLKDGISDQTSRSPLEDIVELRTPGSVKARMSIEMKGKNEHMLRAHDFGLFVDGPDVADACYGSFLASFNASINTNKAHSCEPLGEFLSELIATRDRACDRTPQRRLLSHGSVNGFKLGHRDGDGDSRCWCQSLCLISLNSGVKGSIAGYHWSLPSDADTGAAIAQTPVEIMAKWTVVTQVTGYARAMLAPGSLLAFSTAVAYNHTLMDLKFLIFHPGNLTATLPRSISIHKHHQAKRQARSSVFSPQAPSDARLLGSTDGVNLPIIPVFCRNPSDVAEHILDALSDWLNLYHSGRLHHNVNSRDLNGLTYPVPRSVSSSPPLDNLSTRCHGQRLDGGEDSPKLFNKLEKAREELKATIKRAGVNDGCMYD